jgi:hypothetical protein
MPEGDPWYPGIPRLEELIVPFSPAKAEKLFLGRFDYLIEARS